MLTYFSEASPALRSKFGEESWDKHIAKLGTYWIQPVQNT